MSIDLETTDHVSSSFDCEIRLGLRKQHIEKIRQAEKYMKPGIDVHSLLAVNAQNVIRYMIRTWRPDKEVK